MKQALRTHLDLDDHSTVVVQELACREPGCPPRETVLAVLAPSSPPRRWTLHRPMAEVTPDDVCTLVRDHPWGDTHD